MNGTVWTCRSCTGGFPQPVLVNGAYRCPWCSEVIAKWAGDYQKHAVEQVIDK